MRRFFLYFFFGVAAPALARAHEGIGLSEWPGHVLSAPFAAPDHVIAVAAMGFGLALSLWKSAGFVARFAGAAIALAGLYIFIA